LSVSVATERRQFTVRMRFFHWLTAAMVVTMLGIGLAVAASLAYYHRLISIHRPLGILILIVVVIRFINRLLDLAAVSRHPVAARALGCFGV
jgi:cytochrome b561